MMFHVLGQHVPLLQITQQQDPILKAVRTILIDSEPARALILDFLVFIIVRQ